MIYTYKIISTKNLAGETEYYKYTIWRESKKKFLGLFNYIHKEQLCKHLYKHNRYLFCDGWKSGYRLVFNTYEEAKDILDKIINGTLPFMINIKKIQK